MNSTRMLECDRKILNYLWKWKLMSTTGVSTLLTGRAEAQYIYRRLMHLQKNRLVEIRTSKFGSKFLWTLSDKGYKLIKPGLPLLCNDGYKSESPAHDYLSSVVHIGPWMHNAPIDIQNFSEQELRRIDPQEYPSWVPKDNAHRSDGYWRVIIDGTPRIISLEVELSRQTPQHYREIARYYETNKNIARIIWIVKNLRRATYIFKCLQEQVQGNAKFHNFVLYPDFFEKGWGCQLRLGINCEKPMSELLKSSTSETTSVSYPKRIFDMSKNPTKFNTYKFFNIEDFRL